MSRKLQKLTEERKALITELKKNILGEESETKKKRPPKSSKHKPSKAGTPLLPAPRLAS